MTIKEHFTTPENLLTVYEKQEKYVLSMWGFPSPCPHCGIPQSVFLAAKLDVTVATYPDASKAVDNPLPCAYCGKPILHGVPFFPVPGPSIWIIPKPA